MDKLEDINQKVICIPFSDLDTEDGNENVSQLYSLFEDRDLADGARLRLDAYRRAWSKSLQRIQDIMKALRTTLVSSVVERVANAYSETLPGLPYPEVPVLCVSDYASDGLTMTEIIEELKATPKPDDLFGDDPLPSNYITQLDATHCSNVMYSMRALVSGFVESWSGEEEVKRKPSSSLASYDMNTLHAWYEAMSKDRDKSPSLVVVFHNFEQFDPSVVQDIFHISSLHIPQLPLIFILSSSSPQSSRYLRQTYSRSTLSLLRITMFSAPHGDHALEQILTKTFFDLEFTPDIIVGPAILDYIVDHFNRQNSNLDAVLTDLQLAHMKHFEEPLTIFAQDSLLGTPRRKTACTLLRQPQSFTFLDSVFARLHSPSAEPSADHAEAWRIESVDKLLETIDVERKQFQERTLSMRIWFQAMCHVRSFLLRNGHKIADYANPKDIFRLMTAVLRGEPEKDIECIAKAISKLPKDQLRILLKELADFVADLPPLVAELAAPVSLNLASFMAGLPDDDDEGDLSGIGSQVADSLAQWLSIQWTKHLISPEESKLWDIWYTGLTPFPSELINPSTRASLLSGMLQPWCYVETQAGSDQAGMAMWQLPDTSILFRLYMEAGKLINVYDWFEAFVLVLEAQREQARRLQVGKEQAVSPKKGKGKGKGKQKQNSDAAASGEEAGDDDEKWKLQVQAQFMRALHELDYLGFIKHTGRKADHVLRTVFEVVD
ncbi:hypothetical protein HGRIS_012483 [Hohenbuehelia grisea]|uniref:Origin recognition complex subunit 3 n=1 Tax=Hohenbuehelia grisea TaxID=104357 RepID=A0ABR3ISI9_9AGAR